MSDPTPTRIREDRTESRAVTAIFWTFVLIMFGLVVYVISAYNENSLLALVAFMPATAAGIVGMWHANKNFRDWCVAAALTLLPMLMTIMSAYEFLAP